MIRGRFGAWAMQGLLAMAFAPTAAAQITGQAFEVTPEVDSATVGDTVTLRFRVRLDDRDLLFDTVPRPVIATPNGVRILSVEKLARAPDRLFYGRARLAFYRTGRQQIPRFGLPFMRAVKGLQRGLLPSDSAFVSIVSLIPAGNPSLKDIREIQLTPPWNPWALIAAGVTVVVLLLGYFRLRRRGAVPDSAGEPEPPAPTPTPSPYDLALEQLGRIERGDWPRQGRVARYYEAIVDVLRGYLEDTEDIPARERTTGELIWAIPPHLSGDGLRDRLRDLLDEADLVKFARRRPDPSSAHRFLAECRELLRQWHEREAVAATVETDALR